MSDAQPDRPAGSPGGASPLSDDPNELCHEVTQALDAATLVVDSSLRILSVNPTLLRWCEQWGWDTDVVGKDMFSAFTFLPSDIRDELDHILRTGESTTTERALRVDGHDLFFEARKTPVRREGQVVGVVMIIREITARKQAEREKDRALARLEELDSIINRSHVVVFLWRADPTNEWPVDFVSENVRQFGYTPEDFMSGRVSWPGVTHPQDVPRLEAEVATHIERGDSMFSQEYRLIDATGAVRWVEDRNLIIRDDEGTITHIQGIVLDVTERHQAEADRHQSEERLRAIFSSLQETGIVLYDGEGTITGAWGSPAMDERFGISAEQVRGSNLRDFLPPDEAEQRIARIREVFETGGPAYDEYELRLPGGTFWVEVSLSPMWTADKTVSEAVAFVRDVTEHKKAADALRRSEEQFRQIAENVRYGMWIQDGRTKRMLYANPAAARIIGRDVEALLSDPAVWRKAIHPDDTWEPASPGWQATEAAYRIVHPDGSIHWVSDLTVPIRDEGGQLLRIAGIIEDITDRKKAEEDLLASEVR